MSGVCDRCGFTPKDPARVYFSAMFEQTMCVDWNACQRRVERAKAKAEAKTAS